VGDLPAVSLKKKKSAHRTLVELCETLRTRDDASLFLAIAARRTAAAISRRPRWSHGAMTSALRVLKRSVVRRESR
jgi:hypothetical protein